MHRYNDVEHERNLALEEIAVYPDPSASAVGSLESDVGPEVYRELLTAFLAHLSVQVVELNRASAIADVPAAQYVAHQMKGAAFSFGAVRLDELAGRLLGIRLDQDEDLRSLVSELEDEVRSLQDVVSV